MVAESDTAVAGKALASSIGEIIPPHTAQVRWAVMTFYVQSRQVNNGSASGNCKYNILPLRRAEETQIFFPSRRHSYHFAVAGSPSLPAGR